MLPVSSVSLCWENYFVTSFRCWIPIVPVVGVGVFVARSALVLFHFLFLNREKGRKQDTTGLKRLGWWTGPLALLEAIKIKVVVLRFVVVVAFFLVLFRSRSANEVVLPSPFNNCCRKGMLFMCNLYIKVVSSCFFSNYERFAETLPEGVSFCGVGFKFILLLFLFVSFGKVALYSFEIVFNGKSWNFVESRSELFE